MHKKLWFTIHWILGITAGMILLVVGTSGAILSFEKEIMRVINKDSYVVSISDTTKLPTKQLLEIFQKKMPDSKINGISFSSDPSVSTVINVAGTGEGKAARRGINHYINPYTAEILPSLIGNDFFNFVVRLHRWLAFSGDAREVGKQTVAISTVALIILAISGVIIYWGRIKRAFFKSFTFTTKHHGRAFMSTMHSAIGMWVLPFYLLAALTGLYWSYEWYNTALYKIAGVEKPQRNMQKSKEPKEEMMSKPSSNKELKQSRSNNINKDKKETKKVSFDSHQRAVDMFNTFVQREYSYASVKFPQKGSVYSFNYLDVNPDHYRARNSLELDINSWQLLKHERYEDKPLNEKLMGSMLPLHTGEYFGIIGQIGMFIASALMALFTITGFMLYFNRRKKKKNKKK